MAYKTGNRMQVMLLPSAIEDYVGLKDPVRVYDAFVDALDLKKLGIPLEPQGSADEYYPKDMLKLIIYAYSYGIRSSRKIPTRKKWMIFPRQASSRIMTRQKRILK